MKQYTVYVCEKCGKESRLPIHIESCEAKHVGLHNLSDYGEWLDLKSRCRQATWEVGQHANNETRAKEDRVYKELLEFEHSHNMTV